MRPDALTAVVVSLVSLLISCGPPPPCTGGGAAPVPLPSPGPGQSERFWVAGQTVQADLMLGASSSSGCTPVQAESLRVEVSDPLNQEVEATSVLISKNPATAQVSFVAPSAGRYHVYVIFEPNLGSAQTDALVVRDARKSGVATLNRDCVGVQRLGNGSRLCRTPDAKNVLVRPDGTSVELAANSRFVVAGNVAWEYSDSVVRRLTDTGSGLLTVTATLQNAAFASEQQLWASDAELLVLTSSNLERFVFDGAAINKTSAPTESGPIALVRAGDAVFVATAERNPTEPKVQKYVLGAAGISLEGTPATLTAPVMGVDPGGFWTGPSASDVGLTFTAGQPVDTMTYYVESAGALKSQLVFRMPAGFVAVRPTAMATFDGMPGRNFVSGEPGMVPQEPAGSSASPLLVPAWDGKNVTFDLLTEAFKDGAAFGQTGTELWTSDTAAAETRFFLRGP